MLISKATLETTHSILHIRIRRIYSFACTFTKQTQTIKKRVVFLSASFCCWHTVYISFKYLIVKKVFSAGHIHSTQKHTENCSVHISAHSVCIQLHFIYICKTIILFKHESNLIKPNNPNVDNRLPI